MIEAPQMDLRLLFMLVLLGGPDGQSAPPYLPSGQRRHGLGVLKTRSSGPSRATR